MAKTYLTKSFGHLKVNWSPLRQSHKLRAPSNMHDRKAKWALCGRTDLQRLIIPSQAASKKPCGVRSECKTGTTRPPYMINIQPVE